MEKTILFQVIRIEDSSGTQMMALKILKTQMWHLEIEIESKLIRNTLLSNSRTTLRNALALNCSSIILFLTALFTLSRLGGAVYSKAAASDFLRFFCLNKLDAPKLSITKLLCFC
eukprot:NODE_24_length_36516_cov_0.652470.p20 type:complete len:115 gc:universal NODE_24_length_36516_cov_0.652470:35541-35197(-)